MSDQINKLRSSNTAGRFKLLMKDSFVFGGLNAFTKFFSLFLTPILTRLLTKDQYGSMDILNPIMGIAATVIICGMDSAVARFYYKTEDVAERKQIISNGFWIQIIVSLFVASLLFFFKKPLLEWYLGESYHPVQESYLNMIILIILFSAPIRYAQNLLIWIFKRKQYVLLSVGYISSNFIGMIAAIYLCEDKVLGVFIGQVIPAVVFAGIALFYIKDNLVFKIAGNVLFPMFKYGAPLLIVAFIPALVPSLDRFMINKYLGLSEVATYGIGYRVASLIAIPIMSINTALGPFMLALHKENNAEKLFNLLAYCIIIFISILIIGLVVIAPYIIKVLATTAYLPGLIVVIPLGFYFLTEMLRSIGAVGIDLSMKTYWNLILHPIALLFLFSLLIIMTKHFGIMGAASALFLSSIFNFILFTSVGSRLHPFKYNILKKILFILFGFFTAYLMYFIQNNEYYWYLGVLIFLQFPLISFFFFITSVERKQVYDIISQKILKR